MNFEKLQEIYDDQGRPGAQPFRFAVRRAGLQISEPEAKAFVSRQGIGQMFQGRIPSDGVVAGGDGGAGADEPDEWDDLC